MIKLELSWTSSERVEVGGWGGEPAQMEAKDTARRLS